MLFSKFLQRFCYLNFIRNHLLKNFFVGFNNAVLLNFLNVYNLKFLEKNLHHQFYKKKWNTPENHLAIAINLMHKYLHYIIFSFH